MNNVVLNVAAVAAVGVLSGCGSSSSIPPTDQYASRFDQYYAIDDQNIPANYTPEAAMPTSGSATYEGIGFVYYTTAGVETNLLGDASITANFGSAAMTGTLNNFVGGPGIGTSAEVITAFRGNLAVTGEVGTASAGCNACFAGQLTGTLSGQGDIVEVNAAMLGDFYGLGYETITGFTPNSQTVLVNGVVSTGGANFVAER